VIEAMEINVEGERVKGKPNNRLVDRIKNDKKISGIGKEKARTKSYAQGWLTSYSWERWT